MHPAAGGGAPPPSSACLPCLLEDQLHPGALEDPRRERAGQKGQDWLAQRPSLPSVTFPEPLPLPGTSQVLGHLQAAGPWGLDQQLGAALSGRSGAGHRTEDVPLLPPRSPPPTHSPGLLDCPAVPGGRALPGDPTKNKSEGTQGGCGGQAAVTAPPSLGLGAPSWPPILSICSHVRAGARGGCPAERRQGAQRQTEAPGRVPPCPDARSTRCFLSRQEEGKTDQDIPKPSHHADVCQRPRTRPRAHEASPRGRHAC